MTAVQTVSKIMDSFVLELNLTFVLLHVETERRLLTKIAMMETFFPMTGVYFALLKLTLIAIFQSIQLNATFVETTEECLRKYVMTGTS